MEINKKLFKSRKFLVASLVCALIFFEYGSTLLQHIAKLVEAAQVTIDATADITPTSHLESGSQTVFIDDLTGYKFFRDAPGYCVYRKTTDGGVNWSATTTVDGQIDCIQIQVWYDKWTPGLASSSIHIATMDTSASDIFYNRLDPGADTLLMGTTSTSTSLAPQGGSFLATENKVSITRGTDGTIYMATIDNTDSFVMECTINCRFSTNWTETGIRPFGLGIHYTILMPLTNNNILAIYRDTGLEDMGSKVWNNGTGLWDVATTTFDISATDNTTYDVGMAAVVSSTTPGVVYLAYIASSTALGTDDEVRTAKYSGSAWTTKPSATTTTARGITNVAIGLHAANDDVYVAYTARTTPATANTGNVFWRKATSSMINWETQVGPINSSADDFYGLDLNIASDQRLYASWFDNTDDDIYGDTIADIVPGIYASSTGVHEAFIVSSSTNVYVGGAFALIESYTSHDVTGITIKESGTIDASVYLNNVKLVYEMDTIAPYDCASVSYDGSETPFGVTDTDGFSSTNGTSSFSGTTVTVSTTSAMCVYPVMDVLWMTSPATATLDISINNPSVDVVVTGSTAGPSAAQSIGSSTLVYTVNPSQVHYHWREDNGTEATALSATGAQDTLFDGIAQNLPYRLRLEVSNEGGTTTTNYQYRLEYAQKSTTCSAASGWTDVGAALGDWDMSLSQLTEAANTTNIGATATGSVTDENTTFLTPNGGQRESTSQTGNITLTTTQFVELEYAVTATASSTEGATYCFRVTNAGTVLPTYSQYAEATVKFPTDFKVQRGFSTITGTTLTITAGTDYDAPSASTSAFIRITNTQHTGAGDTLATANQNSSDVTAYITDPSNILTSVTFARGGAAVNNTRVAWEIVEYIGVAGGENEIIVRQQSALTYGATSVTATTSAASGIVSDSDVVVFITGQFNPDTGRTNYNAGLSTAGWNSSADTASFTRGEGTGAVITSYAVVEFTGSNWAVQRTPDHTYTNPGVTETEAITAIGSLTRAFIHVQKRVGLNLNQHEDFGHEVWLSSIGQVSFRLDPGANTATNQVSVAWVIENTQTVGDQMVVSRSNGTSTGGTAPRIENVSIGVTLDDLTTSSIFINNRGSGALTTYPEPILSARIISTTQYELWVSNTGNNRVYQAEFVEWPTARRKITQNYYRIYVDNDALDPVDPWPPGGVELGENTEVTGLDIPIASGQTVRIRMSLQISDAALIPNVEAFKLQYAPRITTCSGISASEWRNLGATGSTTALWRAGTTTVVDGTALSTDPPAVNALNLTSVSDVAGTFEEENNTALTPYIVSPGEDVEFDWAVQDNGATNKTSYCFRMTESDGTLFIAYNFYPTMRTIGYGAQSQDWRWYDDAQNETPTTTLAATNTAPIDIAFDNPIMLRMTLREVNGAAGNNVKFKLQFSESSTFATSTNVDEVGTCTSLSYWCVTDGGGVDNATITTRTLGDADTCIAQVGDGCGRHNESGTTTSTFIHQVGKAAEFAFTIRNSGARPNRVYYFRAYDVTNDEAVPLGSGEVYPSLVSAGASLTFTVLGVASSTITEGVTLDFDTTPTTLNFGKLIASTSIEGAHRLAIDANGTQGYQLFMMLGGEFLSSSGARIDQVSGTNAVPVAWNTGCTVSATSCMGYHTGDDTLQNGSTRFSAVDTYAGFSTTTLEEIGYSSQPVVGDTVDVIFRIFRRELQDAGQYETNIVYVSVPIF